MSSSSSMCARCGQRPGGTTVLTTDLVGGRSKQSTLCGNCVHEITRGALGPLERLAAMGFGGLGADALARTATGLAEPPAPPGAQTQTPALDRFGSDLTALAAQGKLDPVIGRAQEIEQTVEILSRRRKNNPVLIGEPGVGKTAIAEGLAQRVQRGGVPAQLAHHRVVSLDLARMVAGSAMRGQFEERLKTVLAEATNPDNRIILFLDEIHTLLGAGSAEGSMDAANMLKPALARGELRLVGATTLSEYKRIEKDGALARRFSAVMVEPPSLQDTIEILRGLKPGLEEHHRISISEEAVEAAARLADRFLSEQQMPDKAIDLLDQAGARLAISQRSSERGRLLGELAELEQRKSQAVAAEDYEAAARAKTREAQIEARLAEMGVSGSLCAEDVAEVVAARTGIPVGDLVASESQRLLALEDELHRRVIGQHEAVTAVAEAVRLGRLGLAARNRPLGNFLFLGPTGVGKTELAKALAAAVFGSEDALVRLDMSEFSERHTVARLVGSPPGYVGYGEGGQMTEAVRRRPYCVLLLDEIEKAHPEIWNLLLQVMDDGRLTDGEGRTVDFSNVIVIMTSNLGAGASTRPLGFAAHSQEQQIKTKMLEAAKRAFAPEFLNRLDETVCFEPLSQEQMTEIARLMVEQIIQAAKQERGVWLSVSDQAIEHLAQEGFDPEYGARPLRRHLRRTLERELANALLRGDLAAGQRVQVTLEADQLRLKLESAAEPASA